jgi:hypothetical protein
MQMISRICFQILKLELAGSLMVSLLRSISDSDPHAGRRSRRMAASR